MDNKRFVLVIAGLLCLSVLSNFIFIQQKRNLRAKVEHEILKADSLLSMKLMIDGKLEHYQGLYRQKEIAFIDLNGEMMSKSLELENVKEKTRKLSYDAVSTRKLRKQMTDLQKSTSEMEISLKNINNKYNELEMNYIALSREHELLKSENLKMATQLEWARELRIVNIRSDYQRVKNGKTIPMSKEGKFNRVQVTFDVLENPIAAAGPRQVHVVITDPSGRVLGKNEFTNVKNSKQQVYSSAKIIDFSHSEQKVSVNYDFHSKPVKGKYVIEVFIDGNQGGKQIVEFNQENGEFSM